MIELRMQKRPEMHIGSFFICDGPFKIFSCHDLALNESQLWSS